jgi:hypothetical protein
MNKLMQAQKGIEKGVVAGYKAIENGVVSGYKSIENGVVPATRKLKTELSAAIKRLRINSLKRSCPLTMNHRYHKYKVQKSKQTKRSNAELIDFEFGTFITHKRSDERADVMPFGRVADFILPQSKHSQFRF